MEKLNCWEIKNCGRGPNEARGDKLGACPATIENRLDRVHGGMNAGRACWIVAGTFCHDKIQGVFAQKYDTCKICDFYRKVMEEEGAKFQITLNLIKRVKGE